MLAQGLPINVSLCIYKENTLLQIQCWLIYFKVVSNKDKDRTEVNGIKNE